jgi:dTMP kinase
LSCRLAIVAVFQRRMASMPGRLVVLEGIDGAGTTTQVARLTDRLRAMGVLVRATREPSDGPIGALARQILTGRVPNRAGAGGAPGWATMALLFAADRMDHVGTEIEPDLARGAVVISDRYVASSLAYQSISRGGAAEDAIEWIRAINRHACRPDLVVVLDVPSDLAAARRAGRGEPAELYEHDEMQRALAAFYRDLPRHMPQERIVMVDGTGALDVVEERVWAEYQRAFS